MKPRRPRKARLAASNARGAIPWPRVHELLAIVTHPRIYVPASTLDQALDQVDARLASPTLVGRFGLRARTPLVQR